MSVNLSQLREATAEEMQEYRAAVTPIDRPQVQSMHYSFATEDEAYMWVAWSKEDLAEQELFDFVGSEVTENTDGIANVWTARVDYIDRTPPADEAA